MIVKRHLRSERVPRLSTECPHKCSLLTKGENKGADDVFVAPTLYICQKEKLSVKIFNQTLNEILTMSSKEAKLSSLLQKTKGTEHMILKLSSNVHVGK